MLLGYRPSSKRWNFVVARVFISDRLAARVLSCRILGLALLVVLESWRNGSTYDSPATLCRRTYERIRNELFMTATGNQDK